MKYNCFNEIPSTLNTNAMKVLSAIAFVILSSIVSGQRLIPVLTDYSALMDGDGSTGIYFDAIEYDGRLFFGGKQSSIEDQTFNGGVVVWDGSTFGDFSSELDMFYVADLEIYNGNLYAGGANLNEGSILSVFDGESWETIVDTNTALARILAIDNWEGELVVAGTDVDFSQDVLSKIASYNGEEWNSLGDFNGRILDLQVFNNQLYACGEFTEINGNEIAYIARFDGNEWHQVGIGVNDFVTHMYDMDGDFVFIGRFDQSTDGTPLSNFCLLSYFEEYINFLPTFPYGNPVSLVKLDDTFLVGSGLSFAGIGSSFLLEEGAWKNFHTLSVSDKIMFQGEEYFFGDTSDSASPSAGYNIYRREDGVLDGDIKNSRLRCATMLAPTILSDELNRPVELTYAEYAVPYFSMVYSVGPWLSALSGADTLASAQKFFYSQSDRNEFTFGPVSANRNRSYTNKYFQIWPVSSDEIENHINSIDNPEYQIPHAFSSWPAHGNITNGEPAGIAPFVDTNGNGLYEPALGDYPDVPGVESTTWILNSIGDVGELEQVQIVVTLYFVESEVEAANRALLVRMIVSNHSNFNYEDFRVGFFSDFDIGNSSDDYVGSAPAFNFVYGYNSDVSEDPTGSIPGIMVPACALVYLNSPMASAMNPNTGTGVTGDNTTPVHAFNQMRSTWKDGTHLMYGGDGYNDVNQPPMPTNYAFPTAPWLSGGNAWSYISEGYPAGDKRIISSAESISFHMGETICRHFGIVYTEIADSTNNIESVYNLYQDVPNVQAYFDQHLNDCPSLFLEVENPVYKQLDGIEIYPNPTEGLVNINSKLSDQYTIFDLTGRVVRRGKLSNGTVTVDLSDMPSGIYHVSIGYQSKTLMVS
jgi:hypothetical protein